MADSNRDYYNSDFAGRIAGFVDAVVDSRMGYRHVVVAAAAENSNRCSKTHRLTDSEDSEIRNNLTCSWMDDSCKMVARANILVELLSNELSQEEESKDSTVIVVRDTPREKRKRIFLIFSFREATSEAVLYLYH